VFNNSFRYFGVKVHKWIGSKKPLKNLEPLRIQYLRRLSYLEGGVNQFITHDLEFTSKLFRAIPDLAI
jgi:hypothetical protein